MADDFVHIGVLLFLPPHHGNGAQRGPQVGGGNQHNVAVVGFLVQGRLGLQGRGVRPFNGDKQKHKVQAAFFQFLIILLRQSPDVVPQRLHVFLQGRLLHLVGVGVDKPVKRDQTYFRVNDQLLALGQVQQDVRLVPLSVFGGDAVLYFVFQSFGQA